MYSLWKPMEERQLSFDIHPLKCAEGLSTDIALPTDNQQKLGG